MNKPTLVMLIVIVMTAFAFAFSSEPAAAQQKYILNVPVVQGLSFGSLSKMIRSIAEILSKKIGVQITINEIGYKKGDDEQTFLRMLDDFKKGKADFVHMPFPIQYVKFKSKAADIMIPAFTMSIEGKRISQLCAYVRKNSTYANVAGLKGTKWGGIHTTEARYLMSINNFNMPLKDFFSKAVFIEDMNITAAFDALINNTIDVYTTQKYIGNLGFAAGKKYTDTIRVLTCTDYESNWIFMYKKGTDKTVVDKVTTFMLNSEKDKDFAQFKFLLTAIKGKFVAFDPKDLAVTEKIAALSTKYGWEKEERDFIKAKPK